MENLFSLKDHLLLKHGVITSKKCDIYICTNGRGKLTRLDEWELKICKQIGKLNSKKFELQRETEEALKELEQYSVNLKENTNYDSAALEGRSGIH